MEQNVIHIRNYYAGHLLDLCLPRFDSLLLVWASLGVAAQYKTIVHQPAEMKTGDIILRKLGQKLCKLFCNKSWSKFTIP